MVNAKWCDENLNSGPIRFKEVKGELRELLEASDFRNFIEETGDVLYFTYCWLYSKWGINLVMFGAMGSVRKFIDRLDVWEIIFREHGLKFDTKYLINGSNYERNEKVQSALFLAWKEQRSDSDV